ncbi:MAG: hypothetical protein B7Y43_08830 [Sphingomonas sp. 28-62-20]|uniref:VOC family protein n=1 Tax=Sphingomonas sp. 28-62-20 TaxID=1970433 RepID=UPI000BDAD9A0|nr:MAG: hypothetical protein B7Y43_08830 [Sphingomonas sp. 28-62-20]
MTKLFSTLRYRDPRAAIDWLEQAFQFQRHFVAEEAGEVVHAQMRFGDDMIMLGPDHADDKYGMHSPLGLNGTNQCVYVAVAGDLDEAADRARSAGATIVTPPYDTPYGSREFSCKDLEGHVWSFGTYAGEPLA